MILIIILRYPNFIFKPRFWAEEAFYYETFVSLDHWWQSFDVLIYPSYYLFLARLAPSLATFFAPEHAPLVTSLVGLFVLSIPLIIIFFTDSAYWKTYKNKLLVSAFYIISCTTGEVWLTSTNLGFIVPVITFLILIDDNLQSTVKKFFYYPLVFISAVSGPISMIMAPFFFIKYFINKNNIFRNYCIILLVAGCIQMAYFLTTTYFGVTAEERLDWNSLNISISFANLIAYSIVFPLFGYFISLTFREFFSLFLSGLDSKDILSALNISHDSSLILTGAIDIFSFIAHSLLYLVILIIIFFSFKTYKLASLDKRIFFIGLFFYLCFMLNMLSLGANGGFRYSLITSFILLFYLHTLLIDFPNKRNYLVKFFISISLVIGCLEYYPRMHRYTPDTFVVEKIEWPLWKEEILLWKSNNSYLPKAWPYKKNKDFIFPALLDNESNNVCINLNHPRNWELMGSRYFSQSFNQMISTDPAELKKNDIIHFSNCIEYAIEKR